MNQMLVVLSLVAVPGCTLLGLGGGGGEATGDESGGDTTAAADSSTYAVTGTMTSNTCGPVVASGSSFQNTADLIIDGEGFVFAAGGIVAEGTFDEAEQEFDAVASSDVDVEGLTGLQGTACDLVRTDILKGEFEGTDPETFRGTLEIRYEPNDPALCYELLVDTWDATFKAIPCEVEYDLGGVQQ